MRAGILTGMFLSPGQQRAAPLQISSRLPFCVVWPCSAVPLPHHRSTHLQVQLTRTPSQARLFSMLLSHSGRGAPLAAAATAAFFFAW